VRCADRDREGVEDDEGADEQRHVGEDQQERAQEAELVLEVGGLLRRLLRAGAHVEAAREDGADPAAQRGGVDPRRRGDDERVVGSALAGDPLRLRQRQERDAGTAERAAAGELRDPRDSVAAGRGRAGDAQHLAGSQARPLRRRLVDGDVAGRARQRARRRGEVLEARGQGRGDEARRARVEPLAARVEQRRLREDLAAASATPERRAPSRERSRGSCPSAPPPWPERLMGHDHDVAVALAG